MASMFNRELMTIIGLGVGSMLVVSTKDTLQNMQKTVVSSIADDRPGFAVEGYSVTAVKYVLACVLLWFSPYVNYSLGPRLTMALAAVGYLFYTLSFVTEEPWVIYLGAVVAGVGEAAFWPAEGRYLIENSSPENLNRNTAITLFTVKIAFTLGNLLVFYTFKGLKYVDRASRNFALYCLAVLTALATVVFWVLPRSRVKVKENHAVWVTMRKSRTILTAPRMLWLSLTFCYFGLQMTFWEGIYSASLGFTLAFGDSVKELVGLSGVFMSIGGVIGCLLPLVLSGWVRRHRHARFLLVLTGAIAQMIGYIIAILVLPNDAVFGNTNKSGILPPNVPVAMLGSLLLCFGDANQFVQTLAILGIMYPENSSEAVSVYRFILNLFSAISFLYSDHIDLYVHASICLVMAVMYAVGFYMADRGNHAVYTETNKTKNSITTLHERYLE